MSKPKTKGQRRGGRNRQFFTSLSGLAAGLNHVIESGKRTITEEEFRGSIEAQKSKLQAADEKRARRAARNQKART